MNMGAERAEAQAGNGISLAVGQDGSFRYDELIGPAPEPDEAHASEAAAREPRSAAKTALAVVLILAALAWTGAAGYAFARSGLAPSLPALISWTGTASVPLVLLGMIWMIFGRTQRRETERFTRAVADMRKESTALESVLGIVATRLEENQARLSDEAAKLMSLGDEASDRLGRVTHYLSKQSAELDRRSQALEVAADHARVDIGVLLHDLPRAEEQARAVAAAMREAGLTAHEQAGALEGQLGALAARGREADDAVGGAAQRLGAHVARIESSAGSASERINEAAGALTATVDGALARASDAVEATRSALETQGTALLAGIEQSRAAFEETGAAASRSLSERLEQVGAQLAVLGASLASQDAASHALVTGLSRELGELETRFTALDRSGGESHERLSASLAEVRGSVQALHEEIASGDVQAGALTARSRDITEALNGLSAQLQIEIPDALTSIEAQAGRTREAAEAIGPSVDAARTLADNVYAAGARLEALSGTLAAQEQTSRALLEGIESEIGAIDTRFSQLRESGEYNAGRLSGAMAEVRDALQTLHAEVRGGHEATGLTVERAQDLQRSLSGLSAQLTDEIPASLSAVEAQAARTREAADSIAPSVEASRALADNVLSAGTRLEALSGALVQQEQASRSLLGGIEAEIANIDRRFAELREEGEANAGRLTGALAEARESLRQLHEEVRSSDETTGLTAARTQELARTLAGISAHLSGDIPAALASVEEQSARAGAAARAILPDVETVQAAAGAAASSLTQGEESIRRQQEELGRLLTTIADSVGQAEAKVRELAGAASEADSEAQRLVNATAPELLDALLRVREAAQQAAGHAREAIAAVIPDSVAALAEASRDAVSEAVTEPVQEKLQQLGIMSEAAVASARRASERLTRQLVTIGETAGAIEARIDAERRVREEKDAESLSRRVALLIESLNSTAIDVTKILSNEVTDTAWSAYLKGDRGVFTRRAVRLLDSGEAREIMRHYENETEFREQVNRYIHDFESMLRRVLADKDGSPLSITLLSSDMGKLYVALAQAIERLRN
ncbi:MAG TPA: hypothetical protein VF552_02875 [Allosphingosinicella sp.]|jgi:hypothetical protein